MVGMKVNDGWKYVVPDNIRYHEKYKGEVLILQGYPCVNLGQCVFCTFCADNSWDTAQMLEKKSAAINKLKGKWGHVRVFNCGSIFELPFPSLLVLKSRIELMGIKSVITESHWRYHLHFDALRDFFDPSINLIIRIGVETFDTCLRENIMRKGIGKDILAEDIRKVTDAVCLFIGFKGQTHESIKNDITLALDHFNYIWLDVADPSYMCPELIDFDLIFWFFEELLNTFPVPVHLDYDAFNHGNYQRPFVLMYPSVKGTMPIYNEKHCDQECTMCLRNPKQKTMLIRNFVGSKSIKKKFFDKV